MVIPGSDLCEAEHVATVKSDVDSRSVCTWELDEDVCWRRRRPGAGNLELSAIRVKLREIRNVDGKKLDENS